MRISRVWFTVRRMMVMIFFFGICLHVAVTAWRVYGRSSHAHTSVLISHDEPTTHPEGLPSSYFNMGVKVPFWSCYWRCLAGLPWNGPGLCKKEHGELEVCELEHPEIVAHPAPNSFIPRFTRRQVELLERLTNQSISKMRVLFERSNLDF